MGGVGFEDVAVAGFQLFDYTGLIDRSGTDIVSQRTEKNLSQLHYYPNQRSVCPVKQIIIRD